MAKIIISNLKPMGFNLFLDSESYMQELSSDEELSVQAGFIPTPIGTTSLIVIAVTKKLTML